jgi:hypothetical protein
MAQVKPRSLRLFFEYDGDNVKLVSVQRIEMMPPPPQAPPPDTPRPGAWFELRDANGQSLYRRVIHDPLSGDLEVPTADPDRPLARVQSAQKRGVFHVVAPDIPQARRIALSSVPMAAPVSGRAAEAAPRVHEFELPYENKEDK